MGCVPDDLCPLETWVVQMHTQASVVSRLDTGTGRIPSGATARVW
jgi:hypothetical protein